MKKLCYILGTIVIVLSLMFSKPFIEYNQMDYIIYKNIMKILSLALILVMLFNLSKIKKKYIINVVIIIFTGICVVWLYNGHSKDYKTNLSLYFKSTKNSDKMTAQVVSKNIDIEDNSKDSKKLRISYLDVGQGDSIFIELPDEETMLIDAGEKYNKEKVINYINNLGYKRIDYVVGTHPHTDHIGALSSVIKEFDIGKIYMPKKESNSKTFLELLNTIKDKKLKINTATNGVIIKDDSDLKIKIIAPVTDYSNTNNSSAVIKLTYKNKKFLFMGDAEVDSENDIKEDVECDVVKVAHHGSDSSSSKDFVKKTKADYAIISVGKNNIYNHPYDLIIKRWEDNKTKVFRTDKLGDIVLTSDGDNINFINAESRPLEKEDIELIEVSAKRGEEGNIKVKATPLTNYSIEVYISSGKSKSKDLIDKKTDSDGYVNWNWKIRSNTKVGTYKIIIKSEKEQREFEYEIK